MPNLPTEAIKAEYSAIGLWKADRLIYDGGLGAALANLNKTSTPSTVSGDAFDETSSAGIRGGDALQFNGSSTALEIPAAVIQIMLTAQKGTVVWWYKRNQPLNTLAAMNGGFEFHGFTSNSGSNANAFYVSASSRASLSAPQDYAMAAMSNNAATFVGDEIAHGGIGHDGGWHMIGLAFDVAAGKIWVVFDGQRGTGATITAGSLPNATAANRFVLGGYNANSAGTSIQFAVPCAVDYILASNIALSQTQLSKLHATFNGRIGNKVYASATDTAQARTRRFFGAANSGVDIIDWGDSRQIRTATQQVLPGATYASANAQPSQFNRDEGNILASAVMLERALGRPLRGIHVGCRLLSFGGGADAYYLGIYNNMILSPTATPSDAGVLARDLTKWNRDSSGAYGGGPAGWTLDVAAKETGTQADAANTGLILDPHNPRWRFKAHADIEVVISYFKYATGGGTIYPEVVKVADSSVVVAAQAVSCSGADTWGTITIRIGRVTEPVRLRLQGATAAASKFAIGGMTIRDRSEPAGFTYSVIWAFGGQDVQMALRSFVQDPATSSRLTASLAALRAQTGATTLGVMSRWRQNARNLQYPRAVSAISTSAACTTGTNHGYSDGWPVMFGRTNGTGVVNGTIYYAKSTGATTFDVYTDAALTTKVTQSVAANTGNVYALIDLAMNDSLQPQPILSNTRAGHKSNLSAWEAQVYACAIAAGYTSVWFIAAAYPQITSAVYGDPQMETNLQRAAMERAADDPNQKSIVVDAIECGLTRSRVNAFRGYDVDGEAHAALDGHWLDGQTEGAVLASLLAGSPTAGRIMLPYRVA